jgi:predicted  nucleic acid-binding Zn-ribbon protein
MDEIKDLEYGIKKLNIEITNLEKRLVQKKKSGLLYPEEEEELLKKIQEQKKEVAKLEAGIRKIENESARGSNINGRIDLE